MDELLMTIIVAKPEQYYAIEINGYVEPTSDWAVLKVEDDEGQVYYKAQFNTNSGIFNAFAHFMVGNFDGTVALYVTLENANWVLDTIVAPKLLVRRVQ